MNQVQRAVREQVQVLRDGATRQEMRANARVSENTRADDGHADDTLAGGPPAEVTLAQIGAHQALPEREEADVAFDARLRPLTPRQSTAIGLMMMGRSVAAVARTLQVDPGTIHRWKATHPLFIAELNRRQAAMFDAMIVNLRLTMGLAVAELNAIMTGPSKRDRADAMWKLLPLLRPQKWLCPTGPLTAAGVLDARVRARRAERGEEVEVEITDAERLAEVPREMLADAGERATPTTGQE